ncbi:hypothetical protein EIN_096260 [Entamoeba invadens IP1]|uniref:Sm domain-containing protein n=1 Tax=Entamoeba invadens IP1 TaxID=370355 RepID=A0A0A1U0G7_ENTIV|nr:hypothetical protein EIN_096260 [Entamoeba invadens IP1]ELP87369.1 hypothetical protein EIN_096260 [Entamoeba invadens IP1]|eukprot:XP_004254140.1 hypothetical protein EIN_096260 [Entamoeba invadens IP1]
MLFYSFFKTLIGKEVTVELKNDAIITGKLLAVDQLLNVKMDTLKSDNALFPQFQTLTNCFIRGNTIRYISMSESLIDIQLLHDATLLELNEVKDK